MAFLAGFSAVEATPRPSTSAYNSTASDCAVSVLPVLPTDGSCNSIAASRRWTAWRAAIAPTAPDRSSMASVRSTTPGPPGGSSGTSNSMRSSSAASRARSAVFWTHHKKPGFDRFGKNAPSSVRPERPARDGAGPCARCRRRGQAPHRHESGRRPCSRRTVLRKSEQPPRCPGRFRLATT